MTYRSPSEPPTLAEVEDYASEIESPVDAERFHKYYSQRGWTKKGEPITDWKAVFRSWTKYENPRPKKQYVTAAEYKPSVRIDAEKLRLICRDFNLGPDDIGEDTYRVLFGN